MKELLMLRKTSDETNGFLLSISNFWRFRQGFVLPLVFGAMAVLTLFFFLMSFLSSRQSNAASHFVDSSRALSIAKAGAEWAVTTFASGTFEANNPICEALFGDSSKEFKFDLQYPDELLEYIDKQLTDGSLDVKMRIYDIAPLPIHKDLKGGFQPDPVEKSGKVEFTAIGTVGKACRKVCIRKGFKVVMIVHPVLSKFTLFVREKLNGQDVNVLERKTSEFGFEKDGAPIILNNQGFAEADENAGKKNLSFSVVKPSTQEFDLSLVTKDGFEQLIKKSGWVFLNSQTADPWILNLSGGGDYSEYDDRLLLRVGTYQNLRLENGLVKKHSTGEELKMLCEMFQGMKSDYKSNTPEGVVSKKPYDTLYLRYLFPNDPPKASLFRLFGTGTKFSPTLIFGPVYMQYLILRSFDAVLPYQGSYEDVIIPGFQKEADFVKAFSPKIPEDMNFFYFGLFLGINRNNPGPDYSHYTDRMSVIATSPYVQALDYIFLDDLESGTMLVPKSARNSPFPPPQKIGEANSSEIRPWVGNRKSLLAANGEFGMGVTPLYKGNLVDIKGCKEFQAKVTAVFPSFKDLEADFREKNTSKLRLPGIVYIGEEDLIIDENLEITSPGIIICGGNVCIKSAIQSKHAVTIVSLKDITVETNLLIEAHLICLMGTFRASNGFNIKGGLAACSIDTSTMRTKQKSITFEPAHDPYSSMDKWKRKTAYRYQLSQEEEYFIEGGKM